MSAVAKVLDPCSASRMVVFDPPHLTRAGFDSWMRAKYGVLTSDWREDIRRASQSASECWSLRAS
ncbi:MAG: hypothetical protein RR517_20190 [Pseudomonas sp.]